MTRTGAWCLGALSFGVLVVAWSYGDRTAAQIALLAELLALLMTVG